MKYSFDDENVYSAGFASCMKDLLNKVKCLANGKVQIIIRVQSYNPTKISSHTICTDHQSLTIFT